MPTLVVAKFDVWAKRGVQVVRTDDAEREYAVWLVDYANAWIEAVWVPSKIVSSGMPMP